MPRSPRDLDRPERYFDTADPMPRIRALLALLGALAACDFTLQAQTKLSTDQRSELKVLFVGHDPEAPYINYEPTPQTTALMKERTGAFAGLLREHFSDVTIVYAADYEATMSASVDVTVFDAKPESLAERSNALPWGLNLPKDFDRPALMIAEVSADIGNGLGLKLDWL